MHKKRFNLPPLDLIQGFEAAARNLSFTKAAEELFITQSAVSRQVSSLERDLGVALLRLGCGLLRGQGCRRALEDPQTPVILAEQYLVEPRDAPLGPRPNAQLSAERRGTVGLEQLDRQRSPHRPAPEDRHPRAGTRALHAAYSTRCACECPFS